MVKQEDLDKLVRELIDQTKKMDEFFGSDRFNLLLEEIKKYEVLDQNDLSGKLDPDDFRKVCDAVYYCRGKDVVGVADSGFMEYYIDLEGIRFHLLIGQGSVYYTTRL